jgi:hypothetical protein
MLNCINCSWEPLIIPLKEDILSSPTPTVDSLNLVYMINIYTESCFYLAKWVLNGPNIWIQIYYFKNNTVWCTDISSACNELFNEVIYKSVQYVYNMQVPNLRNSRTQFTHYQNWNRRVQSGIFHNAIT